MAMSQFNRLNAVTMAVLAAAVAAPAAAVYGPAFDDAMKRVTGPTIDMTLEERVHATEGRTFTRPVESSFEAIGPSDCFEANAKGDPIGRYVIADPNGACNELDEKAAKAKQATQAYKARGITVA